MGAQFFRLDLARVFQGFVCILACGLQRRLQRLGRSHTPVSDAHILDQRVYGLAATLSRNLGAIRMLTSGVIALTEVQQAPGEAQRSQVDSRSDEI
jgi:hypothetical protein